LFIFSSQGLEQFLIDHGLPAIPLVPVSSSQAIVGAVIGVGLLTNARSIKWRVLGGISSGWIVTPVIAGLICFIALFFFQNVFNQQTYIQASHPSTELAPVRINAPSIIAEQTNDDSLALTEP
jgi:PiT family inorganic phosphate transporter